MKYLSSYLLTLYAVASLISSPLLVSAQPPTKIPGKVDGNDIKPFSTVQFCKDSGQSSSDGSQNKAGACSSTPQGQIPSVDKMVSTLIIAPDYGDTIDASKNNTVTIAFQNLDTGFFDDPQKQYYLVPQTLNDQGIIEGHQHITVQKLQGTAVLDAKVFAFFKGLNEPSGDGTLSVTIPAGTIKENGEFRICSLSGTFSHQPVIMPVAQRGAQDDCIRVFVENAGLAPAEVPGKDNNGKDNKTTVKEENKTTKDETKATTTTENNVKPTSTAEAGKENTDSVVGETTTSKDSVESTTTQEAVEATTTKESVEATTTAAVEENKGETTTEKITESPSESLKPEATSPGDLLGAGVEPTNDASPIASPTESPSAVESPKESPTGKAENGKGDNQEPPKVSPPPQAENGDKGGNFEPPKESPSPKPEGNGKGEEKPEPPKESPSPKPEENGKGEEKPEPPKESPPPKPEENGKGEEKPEPPKESPPPKPEGNGNSEQGKGEQGKGEEKPEQPAYKPEPPKESPASNEKDIKVAEVEKPNEYEVKSSPSPVAEVIGAEESPFPSPTSEVIAAGAGKGRKRRTVTVYVTPTNCPA
ncbi:hypothetical protein HK098_006889 [Nowakowskiella sp. JEL0407]|nr:hypothetical protein HK098_006889 [Nowakowskiella sp. JEL0407]